MKKILLGILLAAIPLLLIADLVCGSFTGRVVKEDGKVVRVKYRGNFYSVGEKIGR